MPEQIHWSHLIRADGGPSLAFSGDIAAAAYEKLSFMVPIGTPQFVKIGPDTWADVVALVITAKPMNDKLQVDFGSAVPAPFLLDAPLMLFGKSVVSLLGAGNAATLTLTNNGDPDLNDPAIEIDILAVRLPLA